MLLYIARQPIFDQYRDIIAYELLYRDSNTNSAVILDGDAATTAVLSGSTLVASFEQLCDQKRAFINFTKNLIMSDTPLLFSKDYMTIEIIEDIVPDEAFIEKLRILKDKGYTLALDDFTVDYIYEDIIALVDIIKVDFILTTPHQQMEIINKYKRPGLKFLAEKVENSNEFERAKSYGYHYFQGYYFAKPSVFRFKDIASLSTSHLEMMHILEGPNPNYTNLTATIEKDVSLVYKLFKYANSPMFGGMDKISTIRGALVRLGFENIKSWMYLLVLRSMSLGQTDELVTISLQRAKMLELLAEYCGLLERKQELFLVGLFSMIDILMNKPLDKLLEELPIQEETKQAILHQKNTLGLPLKLVIAYENANWDSVEILCKKLNIKSRVVSQLYIDAIKWSTSVLSYTN
jgi:EAL and modified HD-GYP domain-containing signal transduction protein